MIKKLISKFNEDMRIDQEFDENTFTLTVRTWYGTTLVNEHVTDMEPMFEAFKKRLENATNQTRKPH